MSAPAPLFDTHCHLDAASFQRDFGAVLQRARDAGVRRLTTIGCAHDKASLYQARQVAEQHPTWITATVGIHPHDASTATPELMSELTKAASHPLVVAMGETGLDFHYDHSPRAMQQQVFRDTIAVARDLHKPIVVHTRNAPEQTLRILREENARDVGGIIHCFSEGPAFASAALDLGFVASFSGIVTFAKAEQIREAARTQPPDALLVETDAPYLAPKPHRGRRNEPAFVACTADFIADLRNQPTEDLRALTARNACRVFGLPPLESHGADASKA